MQKARGIEFTRVVNRVLRDAYDRIVIKFPIIKEENKKNTFLFTGCGLDVDVASVTRNIAMQMADTGNKTLYIDACYIKDKLTPHLVKSNTAGVIEYVKGKNNLAEIIYPTNIENLYCTCFAASHDNPSSILASKIFDQFLNEVSGEFDYIFIDSPPIAVTVGSAVLATKVSGVVIVTEYKKTKKRQLDYVIKELEAVDANIIGVVMDNTAPKFYKKFVGDFKYYSKNRLN